MKIMIKKKTDNIYIVCLANEEKSECHSNRNKENKLPRIELHNRKDK